MADPEARTHTTRTDPPTHPFPVPAVPPLSPRSRRFPNRLNRQVAADPKQYKEVSMKLAELTDVVNAYQEYKDVAQQTADTRALMKEDPDMAEMAKEELVELEARAEELEQQLTVLLLPSDPLDNKNIMLEARDGRVAMPFVCF